MNASRASLRAGLREPEQSQQVKGGDSCPSSGTCHVSLVFGSPAQDSSTGRSLVISVGTVEPTLKRNQVLLVSPETETQSLVKYGRTSWLWT